MLEELLLQKKTLKEIAEFIGMSESRVSQLLNRDKPVSKESGYRYGLGEWQELKDSIKEIGNGYTLRDMDYIKANDKSYFEYLLRNDYVKDDIDYTSVKVKPSKELKMDEVYKSIRKCI